MKMSLDNSPYLNRSTGLPVEGRLRIYAHGTDTLATVYSLEGSDYVEAPNPCLLHAGYPELSMFAELGLLDIHVDAYIGEEGQMSASSPDSDFAQIDVFEYGLDYDISNAEVTVVDSVADLATANTELGAITVKWYAVPGDCFPRTYVWDASSTDPEDGGYVVRSSLTDEGRWILAWGDEVLPCSVYGVSPGDESNTNLFLNYPSVVGSFRLVTAPKVRFTRGDYTSSVTFSTSKEICFDPGARFLNADFSCPKIDVYGSRNSYVADFTFTGTGVGAHSSWFRSLNSFWHCGAETLHVDSVNNFIDTKLRSAVQLSGKTVTGQGTLVSEYINGAYFQLTRVCTVPAGFFSVSDFVRLGAGFGDAEFSAAGAWDPGLINQGHHQQYDQAPELVRFASADRWLSTMLERRERMTPQVWNQYSIDLLGRKVSSFTLSASSFTSVSNAVVDGTISVRGTALNLENVKAELYVSSGEGCGISAVDSEISFNTDSAWVKSLNLVDCDTSIAGNGFDPTDTEVTVTGGSFAGKIWLKDANAEGYIINKAVTFRDARIEGNTSWRLNRLHMAGCRCSQKLDLYPANGGDNYFYWNVLLENNTFTGNSRVWFGIYATQDSQHSELDGHCRMNNCRIVGNRFDGADALGIKMLSWHPVTANLLLADGSTWEYHGNSGKCPRLNPGYITNENKWPTGQGGTMAWAIYDGQFNIWCPYSIYGTGFSVAREPTGLNDPLMQNAVYSLVFTNTLSDNIKHFLYAYRTYYGVNDMSSNLWDEDRNNVFFVKLGMGTGEPSVTVTFNTGTTYFPGLSVV
jgi:hypothetical protein